MANSRSRSGGSAYGMHTPIPNKLYFKIGEVSQLVGVRAHVLRYWEKEVPSIRPGKSVSNQRRYRRKDVETFREIRRLLQEERYTLAGARKRIMAGDRWREDPGALPPMAGHAEEAELEGGESAAGYENDPFLPQAHEASEAEAPARAEQLPLGFAKLPQSDKLKRARAGLRELIRMAGEEP